MKSRFCRSLSLSDARQVWSRKVQALVRTHYQRRAAPCLTRSMAPCSEKPFTTHQGFSIHRPTTDLTPRHALTTSDDVQDNLVLAVHFSASSHNTRSARRVSARQQQAVIAKQTDLKGAPGNDSELGGFDGAITPSCARRCHVTALPARR